MIGKIRKGRSFGGCIRYVTQKDDAEIIASEGVLLGTAEEMARSFRCGEASRDGQPALPHRLQPGGLRREGDFRQQRFQAQRESDKNA